MVYEKSLYNWVGFHPLYNPTNQGPFFSLLMDPEEPGGSGPQSDDKGGVILLKPNGPVAIPLLGGSSQVS